MMEERFLKNHMAAVIFGSTYADDKETVRRVRFSLDGSDQDYKIKHIMQPQFNRATKYYMLLYITNARIRNTICRRYIDAYHLICRSIYILSLSLIYLWMHSWWMSMYIRPMGNSSVQGKAAGKLLYETIRKHCWSSLRFHALILQRKPKEKVKSRSRRVYAERDDSISHRVMRQTTALYIRKK